MPERIEHESALREITRWQGKTALISIIAFFVFMIVLLMVCGALTRSWTNGQFPAHRANPGPTADPVWNKAPPQLQTHAARDLADVHAEEYRHLHTTHWADATHSYATVPIDDALSLLSQAAASNQLSQVLAAAKPETPIDLQDQKSGELASPVQTPPKP